MWFDKFILAVESRDLSQADKSFFLPKPSDQFQNFFFCLPATNAQIFCKMNPLNSLRFISHQKNWDKCLLFVLNDEIDQNTKLTSAK